MGIVNNRRFFWFAVAFVGVLMLFGLVKLAATLAAGADGGEALVAVVSESLDSENVVAILVSGPDADAVATDADGGPLPAPGETAVFAAAEDEAPDEVILTIKGPGLLGAEKTYTLADLSAMEQEEDVVYSSINTWPSKKWYVGSGVRLRDLLKPEELSSEATLVKITAIDSFTQTLTIEELFNTTRYYFPGLMAGGMMGHIPGSPLDAVEVETILALRSAEGSNNPATMNDRDALLLMLGQRTVTEQTGELFIKFVSTIEVLTDPVAQWDTPQATPAGGEVAVGSEVVLSNERMDSDKIYYTTDGSEPDMNSAMYNKVAQRWWSNRGEEVDEINLPVKITEDTVLKAITIGPGKRNSAVATFSYTARINLKVDPLAVSLNTDGENTAQLTVTTDPPDGVTLSFASGDASIAAVDGTGLVTAVTTGATEITVTAVKEPYAAATVDIPVFVNEDWFTDAEPPVWPTGAALTASVSGNEARLSWPAATDNIIVSRYLVEQGATPLAEVSGTEYTVLGLSAGKYQFTVTAADFAGNLSEPLSAEVTISNSGSGSIDLTDPNVALVISGAGVAAAKVFSPTDLDNMEKVTVTYSSINTYPSKKWYIGYGVKLRDLLQQAGMSSNATMLKITAEDGYTCTVTVEELLGAPRYYYPNFKIGDADADGHIPGNAAGATEVEPILALRSAEGTRTASYMNDANALLFMLGQRSVTEQTGELFVKKVKTIEVLTSPVSKWDNPRAEPGSGEVEVGAEIKMANEGMDSDKIYYTTDGSTPDINSNMYNYVASRWWSNRGADKVAEINKPIKITQDTVIKAVTIGPGKRDSDVVEFSYTVKTAPANASGGVTPGKGGTVSLAGAVSVEVPPDAISSEEEIRIDRLTEPPAAAPAGFMFLGSLFDITVSNYEEYKFAKNVTLKFFFDPADLKPGEVPQLYYYDVVAGNWVEVKGTVEGDCFVAEVDHFTVFALLVALPDRVTATINPAEGGLLQLNEEAILEIPPGALAGDKEVEVTLIRLTEWPELPEGCFLLGAAYQITVDNKTEYKFEKPVTVKLLFDPSGLTEEPVMYGYDQTLQAWVDLSGVIDGEYVVVTLDRLSIVALFLTEPPLVPEEKPIYFTDIAGHWAEEVIVPMAEKGLVRGYPDGAFRPDNPITRAEFATVLVKAFNLTGQSRQSFTDTAGHWAEEAIGLAAVYGIVSGYDAATFGPDELITREQIALMMVRAAAGPPAPGENRLFKDSGEISDWAQEAVQTAVNSGLMQGDPENSFRPRDNATRAEAVQVIANSYQ